MECLTDKCLDSDRIFNRWEAFSQKLWKGNEKNNRYHKVEYRLYEGKIKLTSIPDIPSKDE